MSNSIVRRDDGALLHRSRTDRARATDGLSEFLVFTLGDERMALPLAAVQEILKNVQVTEVPRARPDVVGILSVRGRITTILDLRVRLGMPNADATRHTRVLLVQGGEEVLGLVVDEVLHVVRLRDEEVESAAVVAADLPEHVLGLGRPRRGRGEGRLAQRAPEPGPIVPKTGLSRGKSSEAQEETEVIVLLDPVSLLRSRS
jgi:purine-binding chemotaxis protein CheW